MIYELLLACLLLPSIAHAYIDPSYGQLVFQGLFASIFGVVFVMRGAIVKTFRSLLSRKKDPP